MTLQQITSIDRRVPGPGAHLRAVTTDQHKPGGTEARREAIFRTGQSGCGGGDVIAPVTPGKKFTLTEPCLKAAPARGVRMATPGICNMCKDWSRSVMVLATTVLLAACAAPAGVAVFSAGSGVAMGTGVDYTLNGIAYKTFVTPLPTVRQATLNSLSRMGMTVVQDRKTDVGWTITANAMDRSIDIDLERVTSRTTRMRVVANDGFIFKDRATEAAIIDQTADAIDHRATAQADVERPAAGRTI